MQSEAEKSSKKTLFFLKSPKHNLSAIETFLKRRDFEVVSISDYKEAVGRVIPLNPDYVFLAWDHPQEQVINLPKLLAQSCTSKIIPFINSSDKIQHRKLQSSSLSPKLFPPLSGPGIQRLIAKIEQSAAEGESEGQSKEGKKAASQNTGKKSDMIQIKSTFSADQSGNSGPMVSEATMDFSNSDSDDSSMFKEKTRADQLRDFQKGLSHLYARRKTEATMNLDSEQKKNAGSTSSPAPNETQNMGKGATENSNSTYNVNSKTESTEQTHSNSKSADMISLEDSIDLIRKSGAFNASINGELFKKLKNSFESEVSPELNDYFGNFEDLKLSLNAVTEAGQTNQMLSATELQCLVIQSSSWIGYLVIHCELPMDRQSLEFILAKWIFENFGYNSEESADLVNTSPLFSVKIREVPFIPFAQQFSDLCTAFEYDGKKLSLGFFGVDPQHIFLRIHPKHDMIELGLQELPFEQNLEFEVCLYMPENEKFITYSKRQSKIQKMHLDRLKEKSVKSIYTNFENEVAVQKFRAENQLNSRVELFLSNQSKEKS